MRLADLLELCRVLLSRIVTSTFGAICYICMSQTDSPFRWCMWALLGLTCNWVAFGGRYSFLTLRGREIRIGGGA